MKNAPLTPESKTIRRIARTYFASCIALLAATALVYAIYWPAPKLSIFSLAVMFGVGMLHAIMGMHLLTLSRALSNGLLDNIGDALENIRKNRASTFRFSSTLVILVGVLPAGVGFGLFPVGGLDGTELTVSDLLILTGTTCASIVAMVLTLDLSDRTIKNLEAQSN